MVADDDDEDEEEEEDELVDPLETLRDNCSKTAAAVALMDELKTCTERVESRSVTEETCTEVTHCFITPNIEHLF